MIAVTRNIASQLDLFIVRRRFYTNTSFFLVSFKINDKHSLILQEGVLRCSRGYGLRKMSETRFIISIVCSKTYSKLEKSLGMLFSVLEVSYICGLVHASSI